MSSQSTSDPDQFMDAIEEAPVSQSKKKKKKKTRSNTHPQVPSSDQQGSDRMPSDRSLRLLGRAQAKSNADFMNLLSSTSTNFLNANVRDSSTVQISLHQALGDCEQYIKMLERCIQYCHEDEREYYLRCLHSCKATKEAIPKAYADRLEELSLLKDREQQSSS